MTESYPLKWPAGWPRTERPQNGSYKTSVAGALNNLRTEIRRLCGDAAAKTLILSSNATLGNDNPKDCGVVAYVMWEEKQIAIPCDRWVRIEQNVQAIALTIEAMRAIERHGAKHMIRAMFQGFAALPAPGSKRTWRHSLGFAPDSKPSIDYVEKQYRTLAKDHHPDSPGGNVDRMAEINAAIKQAREELA